MNPILSSETAEVKIRKKLMQPERGAEQVGRGEAEEVKAAIGNHALSNNVGQRQPWEAPFCAPDRAGRRGAFGAHEA